MTQTMVEMKVVFPRVPRLPVRVLRLLRPYLLLNSAHSEVRGAVVYDAACAVHHHWPFLVLGILLLPNPLANPLCSAHKAQGFVAQQLRPKGCSSPCAGFSPHEAHAHQAFFGWILPTIRTSEFTVLQIVGLDAAVLLNFYKMSFKLFSVCSFLAITILMPINWKVRGRRPFPPLSL